VGIGLVAVTWGRTISAPLAAVVAAVLVAAVLVAVVHAEDIAHRVGEPFGTLVLAVAVTVIEVALIVTLQIAEGSKASSLARDTVFAAVMIACNGIVGVALLVNARATHLVRFSSQGANALLGTVVTLATLSLVMPSFTSSSAGPTFTGSQLAFAAVSSAVVYGVFVFAQTVRHRWMFVADPGDGESPSTGTSDAPGPAAAHADPGSAGHGHQPGSTRELVLRVALLAGALAAVVGLAKVLSPSIESTVARAGAPPSFVGVVIALLVLAPESIAAFRAAARNEMQTSLNLALGSGLASIGLTIPAIAVASVWLDGPIELGLGAKEIVLLALTAAVSILTFGSGRATVLQATHHLAVFAAFLFLAVVP
jgi:Ca2+:H+ antiporter